VKKSHKVTLTIAAAIAVATARGQEPTPQPDAPLTCDDALKRAGTQLPSNCLAAARGARPAAIQYGGFGTIARVRQTGG
jgi:hypothetical protein